MKWIIFAAILTFWVICYVLGVWKITISGQAKNLQYLEIAGLLLTLVGLIVATTYKTVKKPAEELIVEKVLERMEGIFGKRFPPEVMQNIRQEEIENQITHAVHRVKDNHKVIAKLKETGDPFLLLRALIQDKERNKNELIQRNREIIAVSQLTGDLNEAMKSINEILALVPDDVMAFREKGFVSHRLGNIEEAEGFFNRSIEVAETDLQRASCLISLSVFYIRVGELDKAFENLHTALQIGEDINNSEIILAASFNLFGLYDSTGQFEEAMEMLTKASVIIDQLDKPALSVGLNINKAITFQKHGEFSKAKELLDEALKIAENLKSPVIKSSIYSSLGNLYLTFGDLDKAEDFIKKSFAIDSKRKFENMMAIDYGNLGIIYKQRKEYDKAVDMYQKAIFLHKKLRNQKGIARQLQNIGNIYLIKGDPSQALDNYLKAYEIHISTGIQEGIGELYANISLVHLQSNKLDNAKDFVSQATIHFEKMNNLNGIAKCDCIHALIYQKEGNQDEALNYFKKSKDLFSQIGLPHQVVMVEREIDSLSNNENYSVDPNKNKASFSKYFTILLQCKIHNGIEFVCDYDGDFPASSEVKPALIVFSDNIEIKAPVFVDQMKLYIQEVYSLPTDEGISMDELEKLDNRKITLDFNISFPEDTRLITSDGKKFKLKSGTGIAEISTQKFTFATFDQFTIDSKTLGMRSTNSMSVGEGEMSSAKKADVSKLDNPAWSKLNQQAGTELCV